MKSVRDILFLLACTLSGLSAFAQMPTPDAQSTRALELVEKMTAKFHAFLSKPQKMVYKQKSDQSPSKSVYVVRELMTKEVSSDMKNNDSSVIPFNAYVQFTLGSVTDSVKCGSIELTSPAMKASATSAEALKSAEKPECFAPAAGLTLPLVIHVNFAYQRGKWVAKSVTRGDGKRDPVLTATLMGIALDEIDVVEDGDGATYNSGWKALMTGNS